MRSWLQLTFPRELSSGSATQFLRGLAGGSRPSLLRPQQPIGFELHARRGQLSHETVAERGLLTVPRPSRPEKPVSRSQIHRMLSNPYYIGIVRYNGNQYPGNHPPLIDETTFARVQQILTSRSHAKERNSRHQHYLKGSLYCGHCGSRIGLTNSKGNNGDIYPYFYCLGHNKRRHDCPLGYLPIGQVETQVERYYQTIALDNEQLTSIHEAVTEHLDYLDERNDKELDRQRRRKTKAEHQQRKLLEAHYAGAIPVHLLKEEQDRLTQEISQAAHTIDTCAGQFTDAHTTIADCINRFRTVAATYQHAKPAARRSLNQAFFEKLFITDHGITGADLATPYQQLLDTNLSQRIQNENTQNVAQLLDQHETTNIRYDQPHTETATNPGPHTHHRLERPNGKLPIDIKNPDAYQRRRGSNMTLLAERVGFEPTDSFPSHAFQACRFGRSRTSPNCFSTGYRDSKSSHFGMW